MSSGNLTLEPHNLLGPCREILGKFLLLLVAVVVVLVCVWGVVEVLIRYL